MTAGKSNAGTSSPAASVSTSKFSKEHVLAQHNDVAIVRLIDGGYRLERSSATPPSPIALIRPITDRKGQIEGWRLKPLVTLQGATSRKWESVAAALTATKLFTPGRARAAVAAADATVEQKGKRSDPAALP